MRYKINNEGYIIEVFFNCYIGDCNEYTGTIPDGYETLLEWSEKANIQAYKIVDGNLVYDENRDKELQAVFELETNNNSYATKKYVNDKLNQSTTIFDDNLSVQTNELYITNSNESEIPEIIIEGKGDLKTNTDGYIEDSRALPANKFIVEGKSEQETEKNVFDGTLTQTTYTGTGAVVVNKATYFNLLKGHTYTFKIKFTSSNVVTTGANRILAIRGYTTSNTYVGAGIIINSDNLASGEGTITFTPTEDYNRFLFVNYADFTSGTIEITSLEIITNTPTIDYPSEIETVSGYLTTKISQDDKEKIITYDLQDNELVSIGDIKDELDEVSGVITKRIGKIVLDGGESWSGGAYSTNSTKYRYFYTTLTNQPNSFYSLCDRLTPFTKHNLGSGTIEANVIGLSKTATNNLRIILDETLLEDASTTSLAIKSLKKWLSENPTTLYYELSTLETIQLEPTNIELFDGVNNINVESNIEPNINVTYTSQKTSFTDDLRLFITNDNILPIESTNQSVNGLKTTINEDKTISINGTATENAEIVLNGAMDNIVPIFMLSKANDFIASGLNEKITLNLYSNNGTDRELVYSGTGGNIELDEDKCITYSTLGVASGTKLNLTIKPMIATKEIDYIEGKKNEPIEISITELNQNEYLKIDRSYVYLCGVELKMIGALKTFKPNTLIQFNHDRLDLTTKYFTEDYLNERISKIEVEQGKINLEVSKKANVTYVDEAKNDAISSANTNTDNKLKSYSTTTEVNNQINELDEEIKASLELKIDKNDNDQIVTMINASADEVNIDGKKIALANFKITDEKLMSDIIPEHDFVEADLIKLQNYLINPTANPLTDEEKLKYDANKDGKLDILDMLVIQKAIMSGISKSNPGKFEIDTEPNRTEIIKFYNSNNELLYYIGYLISKFNSINCEYLSTTHLSAGNMQSGTCTLNSTNIIWIEFGTTFEEPPNVVVTPYTTTTGIIAPKVTEITTTGFRATIGGTGFSNINCCWIAIG